MIRSFKHRGLQKFYETGSKAGIQPSHPTKLEMLLTALNNAKRVESMGAPGWGFAGTSRRFEWALKVNGNWRLTFTFENGDAEVMDYQDYHYGKKTMRMFNPAHPGRILREYMGESITVSALAKHLGMTRANLSMIINGRLSISASVAMRISKAFSQLRP